MVQMSWIRQDGRLMRGKKSTVYNLMIDHSPKTSTTACCPSTQGSWEQKRSEIRLQDLLRPPTPRDCSDFVTAGGTDKQFEEYTEKETSLRVVSFRWMPRIFQCVAGRPHQEVCGSLQGSG